MKRVLKCRRTLMTVSALLALALGSACQQTDIYGDDPVAQAAFSCSDANYFVYSDKIRGFSSTAGMTYRGRADTQNGQIFIIEIDGPNARFGVNTGGGKVWSFLYPKRGEVVVPHVEGTQWKQLNRLLEGCPSRS